MNPDPTAAPDDPAPLRLQPIGVVRSPFAEKFGAPRQPGIVPQARGSIVLHPPFDDPDALRGLEGFSHLWVTFGFHLADGGEWRPTVRPPRLGGNARVGVFATRAPFRPNPLGLSALRIESIHPGRIGVSGLDIADGSPVYDLKPYVPYCDAIPAAKSGFAPPPKSALADAPIRYAPNAEATLDAAEAEEPGFEALLEATLRADPRPAYQADGDGRREYGLRLWRWNIRFTPAAGEIYVSSIEAVAAE